MRVLERALEPERQKKPKRDISFLVFFLSSEADRVAMPDSLFEFVQPD